MKQWKTLKSQLLSTRCIDILCTLRTCAYQSTAVSTEKPVFELQAEQHFCLKGWLQTITLSIMSEVAVPLQEK